MQFYHILLYACSLLHVSSSLWVKDVKSIHEKNEDG